MPKQIMQYSLLISCPSDVEEELKIIEDTVSEFNRFFGDANDIKLATKHWSTDSYPESGGQPQDLLNKQFVLDCDLAVAVLWTRFGTPTQKYQSGTEEEIEELIKSEKQVFLYFSHRPVNPEKFDNEQYQKVQRFKEKFSDRGLYHTYESIDDFKRSFLNHLTQYFMNIVTESSVDKNIGGRLSNLSISGVVDNRLTEKPEVLKSNFMNSGFIKKNKNAIDSLIEEIKKVMIPDVSNDAELMDLETGQILDILHPQGVDINQEKEIINQYIKKNDICIDQEEFFNIGKLIKRRNLGSIGPYGGAQYQIEGTDKEKNKYNKLVKLANKIEKFNAYNDYFTQMDDKYYLKLALSNNGETYDEDVDVKIFVEKDLVCRVEDLPEPREVIVEFVKDNIEHIYQPEGTILVTEYPDYETLPILSEPYSSFLSNDKSYEKDNYNNELERIFCYEYFFEDEKDVLTYNQRYIKQHTNSFIPSLLVFKSVPEKIYYEITSKHYPSVIKGELVIIS